MYGYGLPEYGTVQFSVIGPILVEQQWLSWKCERTSLQKPCRWPLFLLSIVVTHATTYPSVVKNRLSPYQAHPTRSTKSSLLRYSASFRRRQCSFRVKRLSQLRRGKVIFSFFVSWFRSTMPLTGFEVVQEKYGNLWNVRKETNTIYLRNLENKSFQ